MPVGRFSGGGVVGRTEGGRYEGETRVAGPSGTRVQGQVTAVHSRSFVGTVGLLEEVPQVLDNGGLSGGDGVSGVEEGLSVQPVNGRGDG